MNSKTAKEIVEGLHNDNPSEVRCRGGHWIHRTRITATGFCKLCIADQKAGRPYGSTAKLQGLKEDK